MQLFWGAVTLKETKVTKRTKKVTDDQTEESNQTREVGEVKFGPILIYAKDAEAAKFQTMQKSALEFDGDSGLEVHVSPF